MLLPAEYVKRHVELGYAVTPHRAQGTTTDTAHIVVASGMTRENLYVAMTLGREANTANVAVDRPDVAHAGPRPGDDAAATAHSIIYGVLQEVIERVPTSRLRVADVRGAFHAAKIRVVTPIEGDTLGSANSVSRPSPNVAR